LPAKVMRVGVSANGQFLQGFRRLYFMPPSLPA
jgi:hypothetical protein